MGGVTLFFLLLSLLFQFFSFFRHNQRCIVKVTKLGKSAHLKYKGSVMVFVSTCYYNGDIKYLVKSQPRMLSCYIIYKV